MPSSVIRWSRYDAPAKTLAIGFTSGRRYRYLDVPTSVFEAMEAATSKGEFFNDQIRDRFRYLRDG